MIAGQFSGPGGDTWGPLLAEHSPLTTYASAPVNNLASSGELKTLTAKRMGAGAGAPELHEPVTLREDRRPVRTGGRQCHRRRNPKFGSRLR